MSHRYSDLPNALRERAANFRSDWRQFLSDVREDPAVLWRTQPARILIWLVLGGLAILAAAWLAQSLTPPPAPGTIDEPTRVATIWMYCVNQQCQKTYTEHTPLDFSAWPLVCPFCHQPTAYRAIRCQTCRGFYATTPGEPDICPRCAPPSRKPAPAPTSRPTDPDDSEDGWPG